MRSGIQRGAGMRLHLKDGTNAKAHVCLRKIGASILRKKWPVQLSCFTFRKKMVDISLKCEFQDIPDVDRGFDNQIVVGRVSLDKHEVWLDEFPLQQRGCSSFVCEVRSLRGPSRAIEMVKAGQDPS